LARAANSQPSFDFLTGADSNARPASRGGDTFRRSGRASAELSRNESFTETDQEREKRKRELEELRAEVKTLKYTIDNHKQEEELAKLHYESELRNERRRAEEDFKKMQVGSSCLMWLAWRYNYSLGTQHMSS
jgi:mitotic spindle assembly checkpoint protein MAD1